MEALGPATSWLEAARKLINDDCLTVTDDIFFVALEQCLRTYGSLEVVHIFYSFICIDIINTKELFSAVDALVGYLHGFELFINNIVLPFFEL